MHASPPNEQTAASGTQAHPSTGELADRVHRAKQILSPCRMCELRCGVDRTTRPSGTCGLGDASFVYKTYTSANEEPELLPARRIFLGGCNFRCWFCDESPEAFFAEWGRRVVPAELAPALQEMLLDGIKTISLIGGEPSLHTHTILQLAATSSIPLPLALNTNMYMTPEVLDLLAGVISTYLADFKFGNDDCAQRIADTPNYTAIVQRNLLHIARQSKVIVRHVLLPGHWDCCSRPIIDWLAANLPGQRFQLYTGYIPCGVSPLNPELGRLNSPAEAEAAEAYVRQAGLQTVVRASCTTPRRSPSPTPQTGDASITLGIDGRVYCHDLPPALEAILMELQSAGEALLSPTCTEQRGPS